MPVYYLISKNERQTSEGDDPVITEILTYHLSLYLDTEDDSVILVFGSKRGELPVEDNIVPVQPDPDLAAQNTAITYLEGNTLLQVSTRFTDLDTANERNIEVHDYLDS